jgi:beta-galactosidase
MAADLDLAAWDWYIGAGRHDYLATAAIHDLTRGFKRQNFWVMETQPGSVNWARVNSYLDKGETRAMAWHAVAHGADALLYWQWRSAPGGQEQYHGTLVDPSGQPRPLYAEVQQIGREFARVADLLADTHVQARVALLNCYESRWSVEGQRHHADFDWVAHFNHYYRPLAARNLNIDVISADAPLDDYRLVIAPALTILDENRANALKKFVNRGGYLVLTARCGMKDRHNALLPSRQPGPLVEIAGVEVEEYYALAEPIPVKGSWLECTARLWAERLRVLDENRAAVIARYGSANGWLDDQVAVIVHLYGSGFVYYIAAYLDEAGQKALLDHILQMTNLATFEAPAGIEVRTRMDSAGRPIYLLINHERSEQTVSLPWPAQEHLSGRSVQGQVKVVPYGVAVLTRREA